MALNVDQIAKNAASYVDPSDVGMDPLTITAIFTSIVMPLLHCFMGNDEPDPVQVQAGVRARNDRNPFALRRRTAAKIKQERWKQNKERLSKEASLKLAEGFIKGVLAEESASVAAFCSAHAPDLNDSTEEN